MKQKIKQSGRTQKWVAKQLGIPYLTLSAYLNGYRNMPLEVEEKILNVIK